MAEPLTAMDSLAWLTVHSERAQLSAVFTSYVCELERKMDAIYLVQTKFFYENGCPLDICIFTNLQIDASTITIYDYFYD